MAIDTDALAIDIVRYLNRLVDLAGIPDDVFRECGYSYYAVNLYEHFEHALDGIDKLADAQLQFKRLCESTPQTPPVVLQALSMAYGGLAMALDKTGSERETWADSMVPCALLAGEAGGMFRAITKSTAETSAKLSQAGKLGAENRHGPTREVAAWAREASNGISSKQKARELLRCTPPHLALVLNDLVDPEAFIYRAIRKPEAKAAE